MALKGDFKAAALVICMALFIVLTSMAAHDKKRQKALRFVASVLLLLVPIIISLYTNDTITRLVLYGLTLAWGVFVALFAYRLIFKKDGSPKMKN
jgi:FtsH-binding integral membrane protein